MSRPIGKGGGKRSLHVSRGEVAVYDPAQDEPHRMTEQQACRRLLAHEALLEALATMLLAVEADPKEDNRGIADSIVVAARAAIALANPKPQPKE